MSRNGSGVYSLPAGNPVVTGTVISSTWANNTLSDIATALTASVANDGQTPITANLPMDGFKLTGLAAGANPGDSVRFEQLPAIASGSFTGTLTGGTTSPTITVTWYRIGNLVHISLPAKSFTGTGAGTFTITGGPSSLGNSTNWSDSGQPSSPIFAINNNVTATHASAYVNTNGTIVLIYGNSTNWSNGINGIGQTVLGAPITGTSFTYVIS